MFHPFLNLVFLYFKRNSNCQVLLEERQRRFLESDVEPREIEEVKTPKLVNPFDILLICLNLVTLPIATRHMN